MKASTKKGLKITAIVLSSIIGAMILIVGGYVIYVAAQYYRIDDNLELNVERNRQEQVTTDYEYKLMTYNLGFGAYSPEYSFFMDEGEMNSGKKTVGKYAKGISKSDVNKNVNGQISVAKEENADFYFFQEVDTKSDRSYKINMLSRITDEMSEYGYTYAENFHTANLLYPFNDPIGKSKSGLLTLTDKQVSGAVRRSFPLTKKFFDKLFDLDRCFSVHSLPVEGSDKQLVLINLHMSAYDKGGTIRAKQLAMLNEVLAGERELGNYVVVGGDFNHCLIGDNFESDEEAFAYFKSEQKTPDWVKNSSLHNAELTEGYKISAPLNASTCRGADIPYEKDVNFSTVIDGFIVSDNVDVQSIETKAIEYKYSDHNPVVISFKLKP